MIKTNKEMVQIDGITPVTLVLAKVDYLEITIVFKIIISAEVIKRCTL